MLDKVSNKIRECLETHHAKSETDFCLSISVELRDNRADMDPNTENNQWSKAKLNYQLQTLSELLRVAAIRSVPRVRHGDWRARSHLQFHVLTGIQID